MVVFGDAGPAALPALTAGAPGVGQRLRLETAKARAVKPRVLIRDDPSALADRNATDMLFGHIGAAARQGMAVIHVTPRLAEIRQIGHRVTVLREGRVAGAGPWADLTRGPDISRSGISAAMACAMSALRRGRARVPASRAWPAMASRKRCAP